jgi:hypothetical protein
MRPIRQFVLFGFMTGFFDPCPRAFYGFDKPASAPSSVYLKPFRNNRPRYKVGSRHVYRVKMRRDECQ